jgi:pyruvate dehydrogenase E2 component (dihydrolipoamide acetyltransferase)
MHEIRIPRLGWSMEQGTFVRWLKQHGEQVKKGDALFELEGDKNVQEIESVEVGLLNIPADSPKPGTTVDVGTLLAYLIEAGESLPLTEIQSSVEKPQEKSPKNAGPAARRLAAEMGIALEEITGTGRSGLITKEDVSVAASLLTAQNKAERPDAINELKSAIATPRAKKVAREHHIEWQKLTGTGRDGRIREADILNAIQAQPANAISATGTPVGQKLSPRRRAIADRLRRSQELTVPVTLHSQVDVTELVALRNRLKKATPTSVPAFTDMIAALLPWVFKRHPQMSVVWGQGHSELIQIAHSEIHIGIAVDTPDGLLVPVVRHVAGKPLSQISHESRQLIDQARTGQLPGEAMRGGTFTITNLGSFGIDGFTPVINLPEIAILGLGAIRTEPVFLADGTIAARPRMTLSLTFDHAAVDGAPAASFLKDIAASMADPAAFILNSSNE